MPPGTFGLADDVCHDRVPTERLTSSHPMLDVHQLAREGLLAPGTEARIDGGEGHGGYRLAVAGGGILEIDGQQIQVGWHRSLPLPCFICPRCGRGCYKLHRVGGVWACRTPCHRLTYASRHIGRTIPKLHRIRFLRRRIGADPTPFSPLPVKPLHARKHQRLCREIRELERALIEHGRRDVALVLERRYGRS
jgi:hypothetical protein